MFQTGKSNSREPVDREAIRASVKHKIELWEKIEAGDTNALVEMCVIAGLMTAEDAQAFEP